MRIKIFILLFTLFMNRSIQSSENSKFIHLALAPLSHEDYLRLSAKYGGHTSINIEGCVKQRSNEKDKKIKHISDNNNTTSTNQN